MPSLSSALQKLHIRRRSDAASSPPSSPSKAAIPNGGRASGDHDNGTNPEIRTGDGGLASGAGTASRINIDSHAHSPIPGARRSSIDATVANKDLPPVPASGVNTTGSSRRRGSIPRSPGKFVLPTIPNTPAAEALERERELGVAGTRGYDGKEEVLRTPDEREGFRGVGDRVEVERGVIAPAGYAPAHLPPTSSVSITNNDRTKSALIWSDGSPDQIIQKEHDLSPPQQLFPVTVPSADEIINGDYSIIPTEKQSQREPPRVDSDGIPVTRKPWNPAYVATRVLSDHPYPPAATEAECAAHLQRHLALLPATIFSPRSTRLAAHAKPGKARLFQSGPPVPAATRDLELDRQREDLIARLVRQEEEAVKANQRSEKAALLESVRPEKLWAFETVGWKDRLEIMDTVDITTTVLEPVIQEHVIPVEVTYYTYIINREIHKYHIFPYVQPISDPNPRVMPTRHLFKDRDGQWREVYGDEAAEAILGHKLVLDGSDGSRRYTERWIEGVDGVEYELLERESVTIGHKAWVERFGDRPRSGFNPSTGAGVVSTSSTGPIPLHGKKPARLAQPARESHASPLRQELMNDDEREEGVGRAI